MPANGDAHIRIARPTRDLAAAERFWVGGLGLAVLYRHQSDGAPDDHSLLMVGWPGAAWHLELTRAPRDPVDPAPTVEDLLVIYLGEEIPADLVERLGQHGGRRVTAHNPYWETWGVTIEDPDGYRLVLSTSNWSNVKADGVSD